MIKYIDNDKIFDIIMVSNNFYYKERESKMIKLNDFGRENKMYKLVPIAYNTKHMIFYLQVLTTTFYIFV